MISSNSISAPQTKLVSWLYDDWKAANNGSLTDFYEFFTTPSVERDIFIENHKSSLDLEGNVLIHSVIGSPPVTPDPVIPNL